MKVTLYMATSLDGKIATENGNSDFVSTLDQEIFGKFIKESDAIIVGRKTYEQYLGEVYPILGKINIVVSSLRQESSGEEQVFFTQNPEEALGIARKKGCTQLLLVGGGKTNTSFLEKNFIDEIILDIHPIVLGKGINLFEGLSHIQALFELKEVTNVGENQVLVKYKKREGK